MPGAAEISTSNANVKIKYGTTNLAKTVEIHAFPAWQEKIQTWEPYGYWGTLINPYEYEGFGRSGRMVADPSPP